MKARIIINNQLVNFEGTPENFRKLIAEKGVKVICDQYDHEYDEKVCPKCGQDFCFSCCSNTNVHEGGKYGPDFMTCPKCGYDYYN